MSKSRATRSSRDDGRRATTRCAVTDRPQHHLRSVHRPEVANLLRSLPRAPNETPRRSLQRSAPAGARNSKLSSPKPSANGSAPSTPARRTRRRPGPPRLRARGGERASDEPPTQRWASSEAMGGIRGLASTGPLWHILRSRSAACHEAVACQHACSKQPMEEYEWASSKHSLAPSVAPWLISEGRLVPPAGLAPPRRSSRLS